MTKKRIHINQQVLERNRKLDPETAKAEEYDPPMTCLVGRNAITGFSVDISGPSKLVYDPRAPGRDVWITTNSPVSITQDIEGGEILEVD